MSDNQTHIDALNYQDEAPMPDEEGPRREVYGLCLSGAYFEVQLEVADNGDILWGQVISDLNDGDHDDDIVVTTAFDTIESFVLAAACAGIDITEPPFTEALETTIDNVVNWVG